MDWRGSFTVPVPEPVSVMSDESHEPCPGVLGPGNKASARSVSGKGGGDRGRLLGTFKLIPLCLLSHRLEVKYPLFLPNSFDRPRPHSAPRRMGLTKHPWYERVVKIRAKFVQYSTVSEVRWPSEVELAGVRVWKSGCESSERQRD